MPQHTVIYLTLNKNKRTIEIIADGGSIPTMEVEDDQMVSHQYTIERARDFARICDAGLHIHIPAGGHHE